MKLILALLFFAVALFGAYHCYKRYFADTPSIEPDPDKYPLRGIDISAHNGDDIDFVKVRKQGYSFVLIKATEGTDFKDRNFVENIRRAKAAGLKVGAYHFFRFDTDGNMQAVNLIHSLKGRSLDIPAVIDIEEWGNPDGNATSQIIKRLREMIDRLEYFGIEVVLYANKDSYERFIRGNFDQYPLWYCTFSEPPADIDWSIWQYSHKGDVDGIGGRVDLNTIKEGILR